METKLFKLHVFYQEKWKINVNVEDDGILNLSIHPINMNLESIYDNLDKEPNIKFYDAKCFPYSIEYGLGKNIGKYRDNNLIGHGTDDVYLFLNSMESWLNNNCLCDYSKLFNKLKYIIIMCRKLTLRKNSKNHYISCGYSNNFIEDIFTDLPHFNKLNNTFLDDNENSFFQ